MPGDSETFRLSELFSWVFSTPTQPCHHCHINKPHFVVLIWSHLPRRTPHVYALCRFSAVLIPTMKNWLGNNEPLMKSVFSSVHGKKSTVPCLPASDFPSFSLSIFNSPVSPFACSPANRTPANELTALLPLHLLIFISHIYQWIINQTLPLHLFTHLTLLIHPLITNVLVFIYFNCFFFCCFGLFLIPPWLRKSCMLWDADLDRVRYFRVW